MGAGDAGVEQAGGELVGGAPQLGRAMVVGTHNLHNVLTLRMFNRGMTGDEIAEAMQLPPALEHAWHAHGPYGSVSHNVEAIYQRYLGWFDGNPAHLWEHPPVELARRYVELLGGISAVVALADRYLNEGDLRFAATLLNHAVFADPGDSAAVCWLRPTPASATAPRTPCSG